VIGVGEVESRFCSSDDNRPSSIVQDGRVLKREGCGEEVEGKKGEKGEKG